MPFQSKAQQRWAYANKPQMAREWTDEMRGGKNAPRHQKEHPIKHAGLPERVGKGYGSVASGRRIRDEDLVEKGVMPVLARVRPAAARGGRRVMTGDINGRRVVGKADVEKASFGGFMSGLRNAGQTARGGFRAGLNQSRGMTGVAAKPRMGLGASVGAAKSPLMRGIGQASMAAGRNPMATGAVAGAGLTAGVLGGAGPRESPSIYTPPTPMYAGFGKALSPKAKAGLGLGAGVATIGAASTPPVKRMRAEAKVSGALYRKSPEFRALSREKRREVTQSLVGKRTTDPEANRRFRQGSYATASGIGGIGLLGAAGNQVRTDSRALRGLPEMKARFVPPEPAALDPKTKAPREAKELEQLRVKRSSAERHNANAKVVNSLRSQKGFLVRGRSAAMGAGGLALLGTSGSLVRRRNEERWD